MYKEKGIAHEKQTVKAVWFDRVFEHEKTLESERWKGKGVYISTATFLCNCGDVIHSFATSMMPMSMDTLKGEEEREEGDNYDTEGRDKEIGIRWSHMYTCTESKGHSFLEGERRKYVFVRKYWQSRKKATNLPMSLIQMIHLVTTLLWRRLQRHLLLQCLLCRYRYHHN